MTFFYYLLHEEHHVGLFLMNSFPQPQEQLSDPFLWSVVGGWQSGDRLRHRYKGTDTKCASYLTTELWGLFSTKLCARAVALEINRTHDELAYT